MLTELGPELGVLEIAAFEDQQSWAIAVDDDTEEMLTLDYDAAAGKLFITAELGAPPSDRLLASYEFLLQYNLFWADTGGLRMALDGPGGNVVQMYDLPLQGLTAQQLGAVIGSFIARMRLMKGMLAKGVGRNPTDSPKAQQPHLGGGAIQV